MDDSCQDFHVPKPDKVYIADDLKNSWEIYKHFIKNLVEFFQLIHSVISNQGFSNKEHQVGIIQMN